MKTRATTTIITILMLCLSLLLVACAGPAPSTTGTTGAPTTAEPTEAATTAAPTEELTEAPTEEETEAPTEEETVAPTEEETVAPTEEETEAPTEEETVAPTEEETEAPAELAAPIKLGGIGPLTGDAAVYGVAVQNGAQIAVAEINALGGVQFELNFQDDEHKAEKSVNAYNALKDWGMQALIGTVTTTPAIAVAPDAFADRVFMLTPSASSTKVIEGKDNVFQMCFTDPNQGIASAEYIQEKELGEKIAVIYNNSDAYSTGIYEKFAAEAEERGLNVVSVTTFTEDTANDFSVQLSEAKNAEADLVFLPIYYQPASLILSQAKQADYAPTFFGVDGMDGILTMANFDASLAEGVMLLTPFAADATDEHTVSFVEKYVDQFEVVPNQFAADAYDCVYAIYEAIKSTDITADTAPEDVCEQLVAVFTSDDFSIDGLTGENMTWSASGEVSKAPKGMVIKDGAYVGMD